MLLAHLTKEYLIISYLECYIQKKIHILTLYSYKNKENKNE